MCMRERERERKGREENKTVTGGHRILEGDVVSPHRPFSIHTDTMTCMYTVTPVQNKQKAKGYTTYHTTVDGWWQALVKLAWWVKDYRRIV